MNLINAKERNNGRPRLFERADSTIENLSKAVYTVNRHAKTAPNPKYLYLLKKRALQKLVKEGKGKK